MKCPDCSVKFEEQKTWIPEQTPNQEPESGRGKPAFLPRPSEGPSRALRPSPPPSPPRPPGRRLSRAPLGLFPPAAPEPPGLSSPSPGAAPRGMLERPRPPSQRPVSLPGRPAGPQAPPPPHLPERPSRLRLPASPATNLRHPGSSAAPPESSLVARFFSGSGGFTPFFLQKLRRFLLRDRPQGSPPANRRPLPPHSDQSASPCL